VVSFRPDDVGVLSGAFSSTEERLNSGLSFQHEIYHLTYLSEDTMMARNLQGSIILCRLRHCVVFSFTNDNGSFDDAMRATRQIAAQIQSTQENELNEIEYCDPAI
jgi:homoserine acetyltransferase